MKAVGAGALVGAGLGLGRTAKLSSEDMDEANIESVVETRMETMETDDIFV